MCRRAASPSRSWSVDRMTFGESRDRQGKFKSIKYKPGAGGFYGEITTTPRREKGTNQIWQSASRRVDTFSISSYIYIYIYILKTSIFQTRHEDDVHVQNWSAALEGTSLTLEMCSYSTIIPKVRKFRIFDGAHGNIIFLLGYSEIVVSFFCGRRICSDKDQWEVPFFGRILWSAFVRRFVVYFTSLPCLRALGTKQLDDSL